MNGREVACGVVRTITRKIVLPVTEISAQNEFFDYVS
jgi:D-alanine-D-alanine ligase-like ATP-grasp enzyme